MEILITTTIWVVVSALIRAIQKKYVVSNRILLIAFALVAWLAYQLFVTFVPGEVQQTILQFLVAIIGTAVWVHEFIARPILDKDPPSIDVYSVKDLTEKINKAINIQEDDTVEPEDDEEMRWWAHEQENDEDWQFWEDTPWPAINVEDLPPLDVVSQIEYHQTKERWKNTCTMVTSAGAVGDLTHQRFDADARADTVATADGYDPSRWRFTDKAVKHIQNKTKEHLGEIVYFHKFPTRNRELRRKLTEKWYRVITGYKGNSEYNKDRDADGVVTKTHTPTTYAHLVRFRSLKTIIDNYFGRKTNVYDNETIDTMIEKWLLHNRAYVYYKPTPKIGRTIEEWKQASKAYWDKMRVNHDYMWIKWPIVTWPKRIAKNSTFQKKDDKEFVIYEWERHEIIKRR